MSALALRLAPPSDDYALLDSGNGAKWERVGRFRFVRPEPLALWAPASARWDADARFEGASDEDGGGRWILDRPLPARWPVSQGGVRLWAEMTPFRHLAFFPDMAPHWESVRRAVEALAAQGRRARVLNLFGYTGAATLVAAKAGAEVTHVDASRKAVAAARDNQELSGLSQAPVRWIVDDALAFLRREARRGRRYDIILADPPKFGRGPQGERFELLAHARELVEACVRLLDGESRLFILTAYAVRLSALSLHGLMGHAVAALGGRSESGEMGLVEEARGLVLPTALFSLWAADTSDSGS